jgi:hypothetical protein
MKKIDLKKWSIVNPDENIKIIGNKLVFVSKIDDYNSGLTPDDYSIELIPGESCEEIKPNKA